MSSLFNFLTFPLGLPINAFYSYLIMAVVGLIAYGIAFFAVGKLYNKEIIRGSFGGSVCHWLIRFFAFVIIWASLYGLISLGKLIYQHWRIVLFASCSIVATIILCKVIVHIVRKIRESRAE